ncbi:MAG: cysteine peptidase family C39 domain-containing protein [Oscillospiraceae bacterium]|nr:cysteine peptidase family C39 domain-containing protein [Oscillospiraceae bacterium]
MKKIKNKALMLLVMTVLVVGSFMSVSAEPYDGFSMSEFCFEGASGAYIYDTYGDIDRYYFAELNEELAQIGAAAIRARSSVTLPVNRLRQSDPRWGSIDLNGCPGRDISTAGCVVVSFTMMLNSIGRTWETPATVNSTMGAAACDWQWETASWRFNLPTPNIMFWREIGGVDVAHVRNMIVGSIQQRVPVIVGMRGHGTTHFVVAYGFNGNSILIRDPANRNFTTLESHVNAGWQIHRVISYRTPTVPTSTLPICNPHAPVFPCIEPTRFEITR